MGQGGIEPGCNLQFWMWDSGPLSMGQLTTT